MNPLIAQFIQDWRDSQGDDSPEAIRQKCNYSLYFFLQYFWPEITSDEFKPNWHIEYLCNELQTMAERVGDKLPREYDLICNVPPGSTKPVWEEMDVLMADGSYLPLKEIEPGDRVINQHGKPCTVTAVHHQGPQPCVQINSFGGRKIVVAVDHPILTADGWADAGDIKAGKMLALMHSPQIQGTTSRSIDEFRLAGYMVGDGSVAQNSCSVHGKTIEYLDDLAGCIDRLGFAYTAVVRANGVTQISLKNKHKATGENRGKYKGKGRGYKETGGPRQWLRDIGLAGKNSHTKEVPEFVWQGSDEQVAAFLAAYFQCDGCVSYKHIGKKNVVVSVSTVSKKLAIGLQRLFLRLGVALRIRTRVQKSGFAYNRSLLNYEYYTVDTTDQDAAVRFLEKIPIMGPKLRKLEGFDPARRTFQQQYWPDRVESVGAAGDLPCRCLSVSDGESFIVDGVVVHNTIITSIMFPVWCWTRWFWMRFITASYSGSLSLESAEYSRDLIWSQRFRRIYPDLQIKKDKEGKSNYRIVRVAENGIIKIGGGRLSTSVGGSITGFHGHILIVDDPLNPQQAASETELATAVHFIDQTLSTRKTDKKITPTILIMQRLHQGDPSGHLLAKKKLRIKHICLPGDITNPGYAEKVSPPELKEKYIDGLLDPGRMDHAVLADLEERLGQYGYAAQIGQSPSPPAGGMFKVDFLTIIETLPPDVSISQVVRYWDKAGTIETTKNRGSGPAYTVGAKMLRVANGKFIVVDAKRGRWAAEEREAIIRATAETDGPAVAVYFEQEPGSGGKESAEATARNLAGFSAHADRPIGDKITRADPFSVQVNNGNVQLLRGEWNREFIEELRYFPYSRHKDQVDAASGAFAKLVVKKMAGPVGLRRGR